MFSLVSFGLLLFEYCVLNWLLGGQFQVFGTLTRRCSMGKLQMELLLEDELVSLLFVFSLVNVSRWFSSSDFLVFGDVILS